MLNWVKLAAYVLGTFIFLLLAGASVMLAFQTFNDLIALAGLAYFISGALFFYASTMKACEILEE